jgi:Uma2 family endonuclease
MARFQGETAMEHCVLFEALAASLRLAVMPPSPSGDRVATQIRVAYDVEVDLDAWVLPEVPVPESVIHHLILQYLEALLSAWAERVGRPMLIAHNLAVRWVKHRPKVGVDPDLCIVDPAPPDVERLRGLRTWETGHVRPSLAIEVVSEGHPYKDYDRIHEKYAALAVPELWVIDPEALRECRSRRVALQKWRSKNGVFERVHSGRGPVRSDVLQAWFRVENQRIRIANTPDGEWWLTGEEQARADKDRERAEKEQARAENEQARAEKERERQAHSAEVTRLETEVALLRAALERRDSSSPQE